MSVIRTENLSKTFYPGLGKKPVLALKDLTMEVGEQEIFGFLGPNGAGKTTSIKILTGLISSSAGKAWLFDEPVGDPRTHRRLGFLPESPYLYTYLTGREFLHFMGRLCDLESASLEKRVDELLEMVGLTHAADLQLRRYSKGMLQRAGIAQAIIHDPELVILDEPMTGLDPMGRKAIRNLILHLRDEKKTVFFSTHILADVELVCDRVAILRQGTLATLESLDELMSKTTSQIEVAVRDVADATLEAFRQQFGAEHVVRVGARVVIQAQSNADVESAITAVRKDGGSLLWVTPVRRSLEEVFEDYTAADD